MSETWTLQKMLQWCAGYFADKGIQSARLDAEILLGHVLNLPRLQLYVQFDRPLTASELTAFKDLVKRRSRHEPTAYIVGKKEFWSREFEVTPAVLIPRPDTEVLVETALKNLKGKVEPRGFEMGLGSGCVAVTLLAEIPDLLMTAVEISPDAAAVARKNAERHGVTDRLTAFETDFLNGNFRDETPYDFIVSNPPYVAGSELATLPETVRDFEPRHALVAEKNGLAFYEKLAAFAGTNLRPGGFIAVEIGETQGEAVSGLLRDAGLEGVSVAKDYARLDRVVTGSRRECAEPGPSN